MPGRPRSASARSGGARPRSGSSKRRCAPDQLDEKDRELDAESFEDEDAFSDIEDDGEVVEGDDNAEDDDDDEPQRRVVFRPGVDQVPEGAEMTYDSSAYDMYHKLQMDWPCLSFDIVSDPHGASRVKYPLTCYWACGSQAAEGEQNFVGLFKGSQLCRTRYDDVDEDDDDHDDDDDDEDDDDGGDMDPALESKLRHEPSPFLRVRAMPQQATIVAAWAEDSTVKVFDFSDQHRQLADPAEWVRQAAASGADVLGREPPLLFQSGKEHRSEGFGLAWSPSKRGVLASGDCEGHLRIWSLAEDGTVAGSNMTPQGPAPGSIEDIEWSSVEPTVLITGQAGGKCQVFDSRGPGARLTFTASPTGSDVNVLSWNKHRATSHLLATGHDDGTFHIWNLNEVLKNPQNVQPVQSYDFLQGPVTSIEWSPTNENLLAVASDDNQVTLWDFSIERDAEEEAEMAARHPELAKFPAQLLFQHMGLVAPKELHWHPQLPGVVVVTDLNGFDVFRPSNWKTMVR